MDIAWILRPGEEDHGKRESKGNREGLQGFRFVPTRPASPDSPNFTVNHENRRHSLGLRFLASLLLQSAFKPDSAFFPTAASAAVRGIGEAIKGGTKEVEDATLRNPRVSRKARRAVETRRPAGQSNRQAKIELSVEIGMCYSQFLHSSEPAFKN